MGTIDKPPTARPQQPGLTAAGRLGIGFGFLLFALGALAGLNLLLMGLGGAFMAAGSLAREKPAEKVCPACRLSIPLAASVCGHCRTVLTGAPTSPHRPA